jgi:hypothetical protein
MEQERVRRVSLTDDAEKNVVTQRRKSVELVVSQTEAERTRRVTGKEPVTSSSLQTNVVFLISALALLALLLLTFEESAFASLRSFFEPAPPPPPPPKKGWF